MVRENIVFISEENRTNSELFQLLNWRFNVDHYTGMDDVTMEVILERSPSMIIISLVGNKVDFTSFFEVIVEEQVNVPILTIGTKTESEVYDSFYEKEQFYKILRPITGKRVLDICRSILSGKGGLEEESSNNDASASEEMPHILVVDDNALMLRNIKGMLEEKYSVAVAPSGIKAFVSIGKKMPDLILLDYEMPEMNGKEVLEKIQEDEELCEIPVVFLTSADSREIVLELLALKPAGYILKPVDAEMLFHKIEEITGK